MAHLLKLSLMERETWDTFQKNLQGELKYFLQQTGLPVGRTDRSLAATALIAFELKNNHKTTAENLVKKLSEDYVNLLKEHCLCFDPNENLSMSDDLKQFPKTDFGQVFSFILVECIGQGGFVDKIIVKIIDDADRKVIKTSVVPSQQINESKHKLCVLFDHTGDIKSAYCSCTAGTSSCCNHTGTALYKIEFANWKGFTDPSCTEELCGWNKNLKEIKPMKIKDMDIQKHDHEKENKQYVITNNVKKYFDPRAESDWDITNDQKCNFLLKIRDVALNAALNISFMPPACYDVPASITDIALTVNTHTNKASPDQLIEKFVSLLSFNDSQITELVKATRNQASSKVW